MPYPSSIATLAQARRRRGLGAGTTQALATAASGAGGGVGAGASTGALVGSVVPGLGTAVGGVAGAIVGGLLSLGGGANPNERPQHRALINLLLAAGDQAGLQHIATATFAGRPGAMLYPTASLNHARSALAQVASVAPSPLAVLQPLKAAYDASVANDPGTGNVPWDASDGHGSGAHDWELARANLALARAQVLGSSLLPSPSVTDVLPQSTVDGLIQTARGILTSGSIPNNPAYAPQPAPATASVVGGVNLTTLLLGGGLLVGLMLMKKRGG